MEARRAACSHLLLGSLLSTLLQNVVVGADALCVEENVEDDEVEEQREDSHRHHERNAHPGEHTVPTNACQIRHGEVKVFFFQESLEDDGIPGELQASEGAGDTD